MYPFFSQPYIKWLNLINTDLEKEIIKEDNDTTNNIQYSIKNELLPTDIIQ